MQVKIVIGTIAFMLTMMIFGFAALREPARLIRYTAAIEGRSIENGALLFESNCITCHGINAKAQECFDPASGESIACQGLPLNHGPLVCGEPSARMEARGWPGSKTAFIENTLAGGRAGGIMAPWSQQFGGPFRDNDISNVAKFIMNFETEALCAGPSVATGWPTSVADLPAGDPVNGEAVYAALGCTACHGQPADPGSAVLGPWLGDLADRAADRVAGQTAGDYVYESILLPRAYIVPDCPTGDCGANVMPIDFGNRMANLTTVDGEEVLLADLQQMADLMSYLLGESSFESSAAVVFPAPEE